MEILVTGATGFLGANLVPRLLAEGNRVRVLKRKSSDISAFANMDIDYRTGDVTDYKSFSSAAEGVDAIFHLAGVVAYEASKRKIMEDVNVGGTLNAIQICKAQPNTKLLYISSVVAIGASFDKVPLSEDSEFNINHLNLGYFDTKREAEACVVDAVRNDSLDAIIVNPSTIYGDGDAKKGSRKAQVKVARGEFPVYPPGGVNIVAVEDVVDGILLAFEKGKAGRRYILSGENITIQKLFKLIANEAGVKPPRIPLTKKSLHFLGKIGDLVQPFGLELPVNSENAWTSSLYHWFDNQRAKDELGFNPKPAKDAIHSSVEWMKKNGVLK